MHIEDLIAACWMISALIKCLEKLRNSSYCGRREKFLFTSPTAGVKEVSL